MDNVRVLRYDWYTGMPATGSVGNFLARQYDHLSNMVVLAHAPKLDNYYLIVTMKETENGDVKTLEPIQLSGSFWLIPNVYTQLAQEISFQFCCKTESGDFEAHSAQIRGRILPSKDHNGAAIDVDPSVMFDPYKQWVSEIAMAAGAIVVDSELSDSSTNPVQNRIVKAAIDELDTRLDDIEALTEETSITETVPMSDITIHDNYYINRIGGSEGPYMSWQYGEYTLPAEAETLVVTGIAGQMAPLWQLQNANGKVLAYSQYNGSPAVRTETIDLSNYPTAVKVFVNDKKSGNLAIAYIYTQTSIDGENVYVNEKDLPSILSGLSYNASVIEDITNEEYVTMTGVDQSGKAIDIRGAIVNASDSWHVVTYNVSEGEAYRITASAIYKGRWYIFTDGTNIVGKSEEAPTGGATISDELVTVPSQATNLIIGYNLSYIEGKVKKITGYVVSGLDELDTRLDDIEALTEETSITETVPMSDITIHDNYYINRKGGSEGPHMIWQYGEYTLPAEAETLVVTGIAGQMAPLWQLQNANGKVLASSQYDGSPAVRTETIDLSNYPTAVKVFVNDKKSGNLAIAYIYTQTSIDGENVYVNEKDLPSILSAGFASDKLYGKTLCCVGDSITYGEDMDAEGITNESNITVYNCNSSGVFSQTMSGFRKTWGWQIASRHNMVFYNGSVSGSTMQGIVGHCGFSLENGRYTKLPDNIDYLLIWFGWNDNAYGTLGEITDVTNESYYGGYNVILPYLIDKYPYAKIGLIVPYGTTAGHREAVRLLGDKWGVAVWDNYQAGTPLYFGKEDSVGVDASIVTENRAKYQALGAHPNFKGHTQLGDMIEEWMKGI